jgi:hypothetical protein
MSVNIRLIVMGDSVSLRISKFDSNKKNLIEIITDLLSKNFSFIKVIGSGFNFKNYGEFIDLLQVDENLKNIIIVPLNLRSFSYQWSLEKKWSYDTLVKKKNNLIYKYYFRIYYYVLQNMPHRYIGDILLSNNYFRKYISSQKNIKNKYQKIFIYHYGFINPSKVMIKKYHRFIVECQKKRIYKTIIYVAPFNWEGALKSGASEVVENLDRIKRQILNSIKLSDDYHIVDLSTYLNSDNFFHEFEPTEHLNERGRERVARVLAEEILKCEEKRN